MDSMTWRSSARSKRKVVGSFIFLRSIESFGLIGSLGLMDGVSLLIQAEGEAVVGLLIGSGVSMISSSFDFFIGACVSSVSGRALLFGFGGALLRMRAL